ncbi:hypothetical protein EZV73_01850 [Acidaminobacter sp. JC074]|uniref:hypothetical protein n=1 Tax=Acidaminobacter sp. JC074 TaxID=2530199 RepID=UPI001F0DC5BC|nr:hypothetical protein [Acidaminobacter sp. JC074]MCH4886289.1 hypothetical protein [Acidaminobacter sp. JC074]
MIKVKPLVCLILILMAIALVACTNKEFPEEQKELLINIADFEYFEIGDYDASGCESYKSKTNIDGSIELEYDYDYSLNENNHNPLFLTSEIEVNADYDFAVEAFKDRISAYNIGASIADIDLVIFEDVESSYDNLYFAIKEYEGQYIGNLVVIQVGEVIVAFLVDGVYFDEPELLLGFLESYVEAIESYEF